MDNQIIESYTNVTPEKKTSRLPAKLDFYQSLTGVILGGFMLLHLCFVSTVLLGEDTFKAVVEFAEAKFIFGERQGWVTVLITAFIFAVFISHAALAMRKLPMNYKQFRDFQTHYKLMKLEDTTHWWWQALSGFALFFLASIHLYAILTQPSTIGPEGSNFRFISEGMWLLYFFLIIAVEIHVAIGLYRLIMKWGVLNKEEDLFKRNDEQISAFRKFKKNAIIVFISLGFLTYAAHIAGGLSQLNLKVDGENATKAEIAKHYKYEEE